MSLHHHHHHRRLQPLVENLYPKAASEKRRGKEYGWERLCFLHQHQRHHQQNKVGWVWAFVKGYHWYTHSGSLLLLPHRWWVYLCRRLPPPTEKG